MDSILKVIGIGGAGINAVNSMIKSRLLYVDFLAVAISDSDLTNSLAASKVLLKHSEDLTDFNNKAIEKFLMGSDMVLLVAGMGGRTGTQFAPIIAKQAKDAGLLVMSIVTAPFTSEGNIRQQMARNGIELLKSVSHSLVVIPNDKLQNLSESAGSLLGMFKASDDLLREAILAITEQGRELGDCYVSFDRIHSILTKPGISVIASGIAGGENRGNEAVNQAISCQLFDRVSINDATGLIINITGSSNITSEEYYDIIQTVAEKAAEDADIVSGLTINETLEHQVKVTIIATGLIELPETDVEEHIEMGYMEALRLKIRTFISAKLLFLLHLLKT